MNEAVLSTRGRITIPAEIRRECNIRKGTRLIIKPTEYGFLLIPKKNSSKI